jgi:hypothetical protein
MPNIISCSQGKYSLSHEQAKEFYRLYSSSMGDKEKEDIVKGILRPKIVEKVKVKEPELESKPVLTETKKKSVKKKVTKKKKQIK